MMPSGTKAIVERNGPDRKGRKSESSDQPSKRSRKVERKTDERVTPRQRAIITQAIIAQTLINSSCQGTGQLVATTILRYKMMTCSCTKLHLIPLLFSNEPEHFPLLVLVENNVPSMRCPFGRKSQSILHVPFPVQEPQDVSKFLPIVHCPKPPTNLGLIQRQLRI